jgi:diaminopimelate epimerase
MLLHFTKMHGIGNDFVVLDLINQAYTPTAADMKKIGDRHFGIGCDQILIVEKPLAASNDFRYRIFNADGGEVENCGNGARCFARYVFDKKLSDKTHLKVETACGNIELFIEENGVRVNMGAPILAPAKIPFAASAQAISYPISVNANTYTIGAVSMGNPHAVLRVDNVDTANVETLGPLIEKHPLFPNKVNVGFMQVVNPHQIRLRVFERGAGETLACGTGACAAVVYGILQQWLTSPVSVNLPGGQLTIEWAGPEHAVQMIGPAAHVFEGTIIL